MPLDSPEYMMMTSSRKVFANHYQGTKHMHGVAHPLIVWEKGTSTCRLFRVKEQKSMRSYIVHTGSSAQPWKSTVTHIDMCVCRSSLLFLHLRIFRFLGFPFQYGNSLRGQGTQPPCCSHWYILLKWPTQDSGRISTYLDLTTIHVSDLKIYIDAVKISFPDLYL